MLTQALVVAASGSAPALWHGCNGSCCSRAVCVAVTAGSPVLVLVVVLFCAPVTTLQGLTEPSCCLGSNKSWRSNSLVAVSVPFVAPAPCVSVLWAAIVLTPPPAAALTFWGVAGVCQQPAPGLSAGWAPGNRRVPMWRMQSGKLPACLARLSLAERMVVCVCVVVGGLTFCEEGGYCSGIGCDVACGFVCKGRVLGPPRRQIQHVALPRCFASCESITVLQEEFVQCSMQDGDSARLCFRVHSATWLEQ